VTRGQVSKIVSESAQFADPVPSAQQTFEDVPPGSTFWVWIERLSVRGIIQGYPCGGPFEPCVAPNNRPYFRPNNNVTRGQLAKIIAGAAGWGPLTPTVPTFRDVPPSSPFYGYVERVASNGIIAGYDCGASGEPCPGRYFRPSGSATRAQAAKMVELARPPRTPTPTVTGTPPTATPTRTRTSTRTPTRTPTTVAGGPCPVFPADNIWNRNIAALPTHTMSNAYMNSIGLGAHVHADFGSGVWDGGPIGIPYVTVPTTQPYVPIQFTAYGDESDPGPYPVPTNAPIEGGPNGDGDRHVLVVQEGACKLFEMYRAFPQANGSWNADSGVVFDLRSHALRPAGWTSADAAGLPIFPGLVRYDEVMELRAIRHALRFTVPRTQRAYVWPARHFASSSTDPNLPPMGLRVRLKASVDISGYPQHARVILQALKDYGMMLADNGSAWYISGAPDPRWDNDVLHAMDDITGADFEAVDTSGLMIDTNSGQSR
jgi:hypothetical protein